MKCKQCGYELNDGGSYCPGCGSMIEKEVETSQVSNTEMENVAENNVTEKVASEAEIIQPAYIEDPVEISEVVEPEINEVSISQNYEQPVSNQPVYNQEVQPMNNQSQSMYNNMPMNDQPIYDQVHSQYNQPVQQENKKKFVPIVIGIAVVLGLALIIFTTVMVVKLIDSDESETKTTAGENTGSGDKKDNDSDNNGGTDNKPDNGTTKNNTYEVKANGFTFNVPNDLLWETAGDSLYIYDKNETWMAQIQIVDGSYKDVVNNKNAIKANLEASGFTIRNMVEQNYSGKSFLTAEGLLSGTNLLAAYTEASINKIFAVAIENENNIFDYTTLTLLAPVLTGATYTGDSSNMNGNTNINMKDILKNINE